MSSVVDVTVPRFDPAHSAARQVLYRYLALAFTDPRTGSWSDLANRELQACAIAAVELLQADTSTQVPQLGRGERPLDALDCTRLFEALPETAAEMNAEYERVFGLLVSAPAPPYETEYINSKYTFQRSQHLADVAGFYRAFGLEISGESTERPDHLALELEFMAVVIGLERQGAGEGSAEGERRGICRNAQRRFVHEHLSWWVPAFARLLSRDRADGFHARAAEALTCLMPAERALLGVPAPDAAAGPSLVERPEECEGCQLQL